LRRQEIALVKGCRRDRWQEPGNPTDSTALDSEKIHGIDEERRRTGIARAGGIKAPQGDLADSESSDGSEYNYIEKENGDVDMEPSGEENLDSDDREQVTIQQETPQGTQNVFFEPDGVSLESIAMGLAMEIARRLAFSPSGSSLPSEISMFVVRSTGRSRSQPLFLCPTRVVPRGSRTRLLTM
jgi:hypothetical protein